MNQKVFIERLQGLFGGSISPLQERIIMSYLLGTIGDRLGVPMETMTRQAILSKNGGKEVTTYVDPTT